MPTFFARRYMRGRPPRTERIIGFAVLGLLGLIVLAFLASTGYLGAGVQAKVLLPAARYVMDVPDRPLFRADPANLAPPPPPHERQTATAMLPETLGDWKREHVQVIALRENEPPADPNPLLPSAIDFGGTWAYVGEYARQDAKLSPLRITIVDVGQPENAFGLSRIREPVSAKRLSIGRGAWQDIEDRGLGFWAGRYYTELQPTDEANPNAAAEVESLARMMASTQLVYGGPFWAESVLPAEGQQADSLRYIRRAALGIPALQDCWLAEYANGIMLGVMKPSEQRRAAMLGALKERLTNEAIDGDVSAVAKPQADEETGHEYGENETAHEENTESAAEQGYDENHDEGAGEDHDSEEIAAKSPAGENAPQPVNPDALVGFLGERPATVFSAGPYVFIVLGGEIDALNALAASTYQRWAARTPGAVARTDESNQTVAVPGQARFADLGDPHLTPPTKIERYTDNLYEKINGREAQYRAYHVVELRFGQYADTSRQLVYDVYLYDMAEPVNAMGMYMTERPPTAQLAPLGREGYLSGGSVYFWKGQYYVNVLGPAEGDEKSAEAAKRIAAAIAETIADDGEPFWADKLLPEEDRVAQSLSYKATSALGYDFLDQMFLANYETGGQGYQMYLIRTDQAERAAELLGKLIESTARYDKVIHRGETPGGETFVSESLGVFAVGFRAGQYMGGVIECDHRELAEQKAAMLRDRVLAITALE